VLDFPLLEWDEETARFHAMHHPFTSPKPEDIALLDTDPKNVRANAYDLVINGTEIGGGSIRIHDRELQALMFKHLGFSKEEAQKQFGFLMDAFEFGAPPHGGIAFGFDRLTSIFAGLDSIRDVIAFPKNNSGRDVMIDSPSTIADAGIYYQLNELKIKTTVSQFNYAYFCALKLTIMAYKAIIAGASGLIGSNLLKYTAGTACRIRRGFGFGSQRITYSA
jgi:aspartyl-tRNA synthetase